MQVPAPAPPERLDRNRTPGGRSAGRWRWLVGAVDRLYVWASRTRPIPASRGALMVSFHRHRGPALDLPAGPSVRPGDLVCEIHLWNRRIVRREGSDAQRVTWGVIRDFRADLSALAGAMQAGTLPQAPVYAASALADAAPRFGFWVRPLPPGLRRVALGAWQHLVRRAFRPKALGTEHLRVAGESWMSAPELFRRYGRPTRSG